MNEKLIQAATEAAAELEGRENKLPNEGNAARSYRGIIQLLSESDKERETAKPLSAEHRPVALGKGQQPPEKKA